MALFQYWVKYYALFWAVSAARPNILLLFPDQWRWDWTPENSALSAGLPMPTLDALRFAGTHFRKAFVPSPLCAPSRACLASGREYDAAGVRTFTRAPRPNRRTKTPNPNSA